ESLIKFSPPTNNTIIHIDSDIANPFSDLMIMSLITPSHLEIPINSETQPDCDFTNNFIIFNYTTSESGEYSLKLVPKNPIIGTISGNVTYFGIKQYPSQNIVTNLTNTSFSSDRIDWSWTDPEETSFSQVKIYVNGIYKTKV